MSESISDSSQEVYDYDRMYSEMGEIHYDAVHDEEDEVTNQGLLGQVKEVVRSGSVDLNKIPTPANMLLPVSFVELHSNLVIPDLLLQVVNGKTPLERMTAVLKYYIAAMAQFFGTSGSAKRPIPSITAEVFRCAWQSGSKPLFARRKSGAEAYDSSGFMNISSENTVLFLAEQLKSDPPKVALVCKSKKYHLSGHLEMFLTCKIGFPQLIKAVEIQRAGHFMLKLLEFEEEYEMSVPNVIVTDVTSTPKVDLDGTVTLKCPQTGFQATVEYLSPENNDSGRFAIEASIEKKSKVLLRLEGHWNDEVRNVSKLKTFLNVRRALVAPKKLVYPIKAMDWFESRRLWRRVNRALVEKAQSQVVENEISRIKKQESKSELHPSHLKVEDNKVVHLRYQRTNRTARG